MDQSPKFDLSRSIPSWRDVDDARRDLARLIEDFVAQSVEAHNTEDPEPVLAVKVTAGTGKTGAALNALAHHAERLLAQGHVLVHTPTLELASRACADFRKIAPGIPSAVVRGRQAADPSRIGHRMCDRHELAARLEGLVPSLTEAMCYAEQEDGTAYEAPCAARCPYLAQKSEGGAKVYFLSHAYLKARPPIDQNHPVVLRIIDEKVWPTLSQTIPISIENFMRAPALGFSHVLRPGLNKARSAILHALQTGAPLAETLADAKIGDQALKNLSKEEAASRVALDIRPWDSDEQAAQKLSVFQLTDFRASRLRQRVFEEIGERLPASSIRLSYCDELERGEARQFIKFHALALVPRDAPVLLLDADIDDEIVERIAPGAQIRQIEVKPKANVIQIADRNLSNSWLLNPEHGPKRQAAILDVVAREVDRAQGGGVLLVATKAVLKALHAKAGQPVGEDVEEGLRQDLCGASARWFGPSTQGVNDFEGYTTIIVVGRLQPRPSAIEDATRCIFGDDETPLVPNGPFMLPERPAWHLMDNDDLIKTSCRTHSDPRACRVLSQMRECQTLQAIARLRLVSPSKPKRVVVLSSLPLPGFPVTQLVPLEAVLRGIEQEADVSGYIRLERALRATRGKSVRGTRLSAAGLAADLPKDFTSVDIARNFRRGRTSHMLLRMAKRIAARNGWPISVLSLRRAGGGKPTPAIVLCSSQDAVPWAKKLWPGLTAK
ncbi:hypothetical protein OB2597_04865 [Pseudooceanicola batsensis HTCC2597]|uniref:Helicase/UvrB N-terminal domain-containing protein n=1 Tax=Pseudooceanicola batsensis (strain ATCC BAA-863 / DSM 15984 / KCTC 12145 / HTCC2597) TaxID=252305 RepID=A3TSF8_PSEBH|nr:hypothetical protein [Pseudooceanicola batsensis]EAQ04585.1 hypothetical protein OB2597_04865 [Pseudooceanicola batsensis HTCC2597]